MLGTSIQANQSIWVYIPLFRTVAWCFVYAYKRTAGHRSNRSAPQAISAMSAAASSKKSAIELDNRIVLVTGANGGIGAACASSLLAAGARVILHCRSSDSVASAIAAASDSDHAVVVKADLSSPEEVDQLWVDALAVWGSIDCIVNNAAVFEPVEPAIASPAEWRAAWSRCLSINLQAPADLCYHALAHFKQRGGGKVINITSRAASRGDDPAYMQYAASKAGLTALTKSIARGFGHANIQAFNVAPGWVDTPMAVQHVASAGGHDAVGATIPTGSICPPEEIASLVAFLASPLAKHSSGATFDVNGASHVR